MTVPRDWIDGCVAFYRNSNSNTNLPNLLEFVAQQWFLVDFQSIKLRSLPVNLQNSALVNLKENYIVQVFIIPIHIERNQTNAKPFLYKCS
jgi:hypothetical protein